jgi:hypothetical protein
MKFISIYQDEVSRKPLIEYHDLKVKLDSANEKFENGIKQFLIEFDSYPHVMKGVCGFETFVLSEKRVMFAGSFTT